MRLIDTDKLRYRHFFSRGGHSYECALKHDIFAITPFDLEAFEKEIREDERKKVLEELT